jgi:hypothetical protein
MSFIQNLAEHAALFIVVNIWDLDQWFLMVAVAEDL